MLQWLVDLGQTAVLVRSSSFPRMQSTLEVARRCRGRNRLLARSCSPSYFQMEVQGCACDEAATFSRMLIVVALRRDISGQSPCLLSTSAMSKSNVETKGATQKHSAKKSSLIPVSGFPFHMGRGVPGDGAGAASLRLGWRRGGRPKPFRSRQAHTSIY